MTREHQQTHVWKGLQQLIASVRDLDSETVELIARKAGGRRPGDRLYRQSVATLTSRLRTGVNDTQSKSTPFPSLCANAAELTLWNLIYTDHDLYAFLHDEVLVQVPGDTMRNRPKA
jgi:hypothetical protein